MENFYNHTTFVSKIEPKSINDALKDEHWTTTMQDEPAAETQEDDHNDANMGERMTTMSPFERLMINRMDTFVDN